ncbi:hypothetical protein E3N88_09632 [Mikania micrantha]|uniref:PGG domain-containing protein n=1 Tax=Mikania micrantha TaxID=192012 RepID=A0A5N6PLV0_9ASTR|nr:hypothetical protein E3N88_09632 [Mikania micrantha]
MTINGNTALHVAVGTTNNNRQFLDNMFDLAKKHNQPSLDMLNSEGSNLLHVAAIVGNTEAVKILVERNRDLLDHYLDTLDVEKGDLFDSSEIIVNAISSKDYESAYKMRNLTRDPNIVLTAIAQNFPPNVNCFEGAQRKAKAYSDAIKLLRVTCDHITTSTTYNNAIFEASRQNAVEVVKEIVSQFPNAIWSINEYGHNIIQHAVINRSEKVYNLLYQMSEHKNIYRTIKDPCENNLLHLAARLAPENKLNPILGAALKIQRELQWFKEVESFVCPLNTIQKNSLGETPHTVFTKEHKNLLIEGEKWMKETAQSYTITATLITTIMFASAITVPGGSKQDNGIPVFANISLFTIFAISDVISFFTSVASLLMFLSIVTDSFTEQNFLVKLPTKLIIGLDQIFPKESSFDLEDLTDFLTIKKEKVSPVAPKARIMHTHSTKISKKRKGADTVNVDDIPDLPAVDLLYKAILKISGDKEAYENQIEDIEDQKKIDFAKAGHYEKEALTFKKLAKDNDAAHKLKIKEIIEGTKKSAAATILQAKIQIAEKSKQEGSDLWDKDLADWVKVLAKLTGDMAETSAAKTASVVETSKVAGGEDIGAGGGAGDVAMGDEDRVDKV